MADKLPIVLVHGYSDQGSSFEHWRDALVAAGYAKDQVHICQYRSLTNEVTIKDVAEGFDRALKTKAGLSSSEPFDAIVHSTGMLVVRSWLDTYRERGRRLRRLVALAPATHGSPLAHRGRGLMGALFKGYKIPGPDFMEAGDLILDGLELGSRFTWELTERDLLSENPVFQNGPESPYVFIFCGTCAYEGARALVNDPGSDGTVRWAGTSLDTQKIRIDLAREANPMNPAIPQQRVASRDIRKHNALPMPLYPILGKNHATILSEPDGVLLELVLKALRDVRDEQTFNDWSSEAEKKTVETRDGLKKWQQFVVRAVDERGDGIPDYFVELFTRKGPLRERINFDINVHAYGADPSFRCFHVNLTDLLADFPDGKIPGLHVRVIASSGTELVGYHGLGSQRIDADLTRKDEDAVWDAEIALPETFSESGVALFHPFTTTFVELRLNRDPTPFGVAPNKVCFFL